LVAAGIALTRPTVRQWVSDFISPIPTATTSPRAKSSPESGPAQVVITGAESSELKSLVAPDAGAPRDRGARTILFPRDVPPIHDGYVKPHGLKRPELASRDDATIDRALQYLATDSHGHGALVAAYQRSGQHRDEVDRILRAWKVPTELAAVAYIESAFVPTATSLDGGAGLWSLTPEVSRGYGITILPKYDERRSVALATETAAHYLADLRERFGSWELALLAFGQGYGRTMSVLLKQTSLEYWDVVSDLPPDGTNYVAEVLAVATVLENPARFGLDIVKPDDPIVTSDLEVPSDATFSILARAAGTSVEKLHELNPEYLGESVPSTSFAMIVHLPSAGLARAKELLMPLMYSTSGAGGGSTFDWGHGGANGAKGAKDTGADGGPGATPDAPAPVPTLVAQHGNGKKSYYHVVDGDTLDSLARRYGIPRDTIASDNALDPSAGLKPGQLLLLQSGGNGGPPPGTP
jgi:membrane-bound lytic murein transglycosylase D